MSTRTCGGESPSQGGGRQLAMGQSLIVGVSFRRETYSAGFEDVFVVGRN